MKKIIMPHGKFTLVDDRDFLSLSQHQWSLDGTGHAHGWDGKAKRFVKMHRKILDAPCGMCVDHINGDKLNNQRHNLRLCTHSQNSANRTHPPQGKSGYYGVYWHKGKRKWQARITKDYRDISIGYFERAEDAAFARDIKAAELFGEFATLNFPGGANA